MGDSARPGEYREYLLCPAAATGTTQCAPQWYGGSTAPATVDVQIPARIFTVSSGSTSTTDCRTTACEVRAVQLNGLTTSDVVAATTVSFDPTAPLRTAPTISVTPSTGLADGQHVTATVTPADASLPILECTKPITTIADLADITAKCVPAGAEGVAGGPPPGTVVQAYIETPSGPVDCRAPGATCVLTTVDPVGQSANAPLGFDPNAPAAPALLLRDQAPVAPPGVETYDLIGFTPGDPYTVRWCNPQGDCLPGNVATGTLDSHGTASFTNPAAGFPDVPPGDTTCATSCTLTATDAHGRSAQGGPEIGVVTGTPPPAPFQSSGLPVTITPDTGLTDGEQVHVTASGFPAGAQVAIVECIGGAMTAGAADCDLNTSTFLNGTTITADAQGNVSADYTIRRSIDGPNGPVDCAQGNIDPSAYANWITTHPSGISELAGKGYFSCVVAVADIADYQTSGGAPIAFAGARFKALPEPAPEPAPKEPTTAENPNPQAATPVVAQPDYAG